MQVFNKNVTHRRAPVISKPMRGGSNLGESLRRCRAICCIRALILSK
jgi:hypothetical protein